MSDVFISYSRKDSAFAKRLTNALKVREKDVWIDWEDIPRAEDWLNEIYSGIESADTFVFIVSEHSLRSEICNYEIAHARKNNKRIVPLIHQRIEDEVEIQVKGSWVDQPWEQTARDNWQRIRHLNWLFFDDEDRFESELEALDETLGTDQTHVKLHTRLLVRAREWESSGRAPGFLLTEEEIEQAEIWLQTAEREHKSPEPIDLHQLYILESREAEDLRQARLRRLETRTRQFRLASLGLLMMTVIAIIAVIASANQLSSTQSQVSEAQTNLTQANFDLQVAASQATESNMQVAVAQSTLTQIAPAQTQVRSSLLTMTPAQATLAAANAEVATVFAQGTALISEVQDQLDLGNSLRLGAAAASLLRNDGDAELATLLSIRGLQFAQTEQTALTLENSVNEITVVHNLPGINYVRASEPAPSFMPTTSPLDLSQLPLDNPEDYIFPTSPPNSRVQDIPQLDSPRGAVAISPDNTWLAVASGYSVYLYALADGEIEQRTFADSETVASHGDNILTLDFSADGLYLVTGAADGTASLWDVETGQRIRSLRQPDASSNEALRAIGEVPTVRLSPDAETILGLRGSTVLLWDREPGLVRDGFETLQDGDIPSVGSNVNIAASFSPDGSTAILFAKIDTVEYEPQTFGSANLFESMSWNTRFLVRAYDVRNGRIMATMEDETRHTEGVLNPDLFVKFGVAFAPDSETALVWLSRRATIYRVRSGIEEITLNIELGANTEANPTAVLTNGITAADFSEDGNTLVIASDSTITLWDVSTGSFMRSVGAVPGSILSLDLSADGRYLVAGSTQSVRVWDLYSEPTETVTFTGDYDGLITQACERVLRDFTSSERETYGLDDIATCPVDGTEE